jgi:hypothetical protein
MFLLREVGAETLDLQVNRLALLSGEGGGGVPRLHVAAILMPVMLSLTGMGCLV